MGNLTGDIGESGVFPDAKLPADTRFPTTRDFPEAKLDDDCEAAMVELPFGAFSFREKKPMLVGCDTRSAKLNQAHSQVAEEGQGAGRELSRATSRR